MSTDQSNLSDPRFGYDLVVAVTQKYINLTMKEFLDGVTAPEVLCCYVFNAAGDMEPIAYDTLKANAKGSDPFSVANGADPNTNQDLKNLSDANFAGGFKARIGLPDMDPDKIPPIVTLQQGKDAPVIFNLLCAEFQIAGFHYRGRHADWINLAQPSGAPWYFSSKIKLAASPVDPKTPVPPAVQARINQLNGEIGPGAFSVQQLLLELATAEKWTTPTIPNIPPEMALYSVIMDVFVGAYFKQMQVSGQPVLGYSMTVNKPDPSTLRLGAVTHECSLLLDASGNPIANPTLPQQNSATFNYLCTTGTTPPEAKPFPWNWVESSELDKFHGVQSVRRDIFLNILATTISKQINATLCITPGFAFGENASNDWVYFKESTTWSGACQLSIAPPPTKPVPRGEWSTVFGIAFDPALCDSTLYPSGAGFLGDGYSCTVKYQLTGDLSLSVNSDGIPLLRLRLHSTVMMAASHREAWIAWYHNLPAANYVDCSLSLTYQMSVDPHGNLVVSNATPEINNKSTPYHFYPTGVENLTALRDYLQKICDHFSDTVFREFKNVSPQLQEAINHAHAWVFPGGKTFHFNTLGLSDYQDLISHVTYVEPS